ERHERKTYGYAGGRSGRLPPDLLETLFRSFEANLEDMASLARSRRLALVLCTQVSNIRTVQPLATLAHPWMYETQRRRVKEARRQALGQFDACQPDRALATIEQARQVDPSDPMLSYLSGKILLARGETERARADLQSALENDSLRHRAPARINESIRSVA